MAAPRRPPPAWRGEVESEEEEEEEERGERRRQTDRERENSKPEVTLIPVDRWGKRANKVLNQKH